MASEHEQPAKPIVFVGQSLAANWNVHNVYSDSISGAFALTQHLIRLGHRNIAMITGRESSASAGDRVAGYCMALADANLPLDRDRICWGEYDRKTAERLTDQLLDRLPDTTGIVAANNEIASGVIQALEKRGLPVPESVAVVCFDDFHPDSRFAAMMTVASQSPYDLGINAVQLLLNRLNNHDYPRPQTIVLPARLIVRQSCGGPPTPVDDDSAFDNVQGQLIPSLSRPQIVALAADVRSVIDVTLPPVDSRLIQANKTQVALLQRALRRESAALGSVPHFEYALTGRSLYRYVLERDPAFDFVGSTALISPEDQVEFAERSGIAAIPCRFPYQPGLASFDEGEVAFGFPLFTEQLDFFDRYVRAARARNVGIAADFRGLVADSLRIFQSLTEIADGTPRPTLEQIADHLLDYGRKVVQLICDRFAADLAFVLISDEIADENGLLLPPDVFQSIFSARLRRLIHPAQEHGLATVLYTPGNVAAAIPLIRDMGFDGVYVAQAELNDLAALQHAAGGRLSLMGGIPRSLLTSDIQPEAVKAIVARLAAGGGWIAGVSGVVNDAVSAENFVALVDAVSAVNGANAPS
jgi:DNA-binding LacI/PurR family transcriptional regulator